MAWILARQMRDGTRKYYVRDVRDGRQVVIPCPDNVDRPFAERMLSQYVSRRDLEKHGYDDKYASKLKPRTSER